MTDAPSVKAEPAFHQQTWDLSYKHALGKTIGGFLNGLKEKKILGRRCPKCERTLVPARSFCDRCHVETAEWVEVAHAGEMTMATTIMEPFKNLPKPPYAVAYALLDGADTAMVGFVKGLDLSDPRKAAEAMKPGKRLTVKFKDQPEGEVTDYWFEMAP